MKRWCAFLVLIPFLVCASLISAQAAVEWEVWKTFTFTETPVDVAVSRDGNWVYVLAAGGNLFIYSSAGELRDTIKVEQAVDGINAGPREDILFLTSTAKKTLEIVTLDFVQQIDVSGSPSKGPKDAPVVMALFTDFQ